MRLDTTFFRIDNGVIIWYDLEFPDVIELRKKLIPQNERIKFIGKSVFDYSWLDDIDTPQDGIIFVAEGILMYFEEEQVKELFSTLASRFPNSEIVFDAHSRIDNSGGNVLLKRLGVEGSFSHKWAIKKAKKIAQWDERIEIVDEYSAYSRIPRNPSWGEDVIAKMDIVDNTRNWCIFHFRFNES